MKKCPKCKELKPFSEYSKAKNTYKNMSGFTCYCKKCLSINGRIYYKKNKIKRCEYQKEWMKRNPEKRKMHVKNWRDSHLDQQRERGKINQSKYRKTLFGKLNSSMSGSIRQSIIKKQGHHWEILVGYTVDQLKQHLKKQFKPGMTWKNYGRNGWHIDHVIPKSKFNFSDTKHLDFKRCWALKNLRPLWAKENLFKSNKLRKTFQPSLQI